MQHGQKKLLWSGLTVLTALVLTFTLFQLLYRLDNKYTAGPPYGEKGRFSFSEDDLSSPLFLIDGWEWYPDVLDSPARLASENARAPYQIFIGQYSNFAHPDSTHSPFGQATYRLLLEYDGDPRPLTLEIPELYTEYVLWINGKQAARTGSGPSVTFLAENRIELVLNVENQTHYYSGMTYPPILAAPEVFSRIEWARTTFYAAMILCPLTLALFSCVFWARRERGIQRTFGMLCLFFAISCLHPFVWRLGLSGRIWYAAEDAARMAVLASAAMICSEIAGFGGRLWYRRRVRGIAAAIVPLTALCVFFIIPTFPGFLNLYALLVSCVQISAWLYLTFCAVAGIAREAAGGQFILSGGIVYGAGLLLNLADDNHFEPIVTGWQSEYVGFLLVLIFGGMMAVRNYEIIQSNRQLVGHMEELVEQRTAELHAVLEERKAFFSDFAHNLKAPSAAIHMFVGMIRDSNLYLDQELEGYLRMIERENIEMQQRVSSLRTINAFDRIHAPTERIRLDELLEEVREKNQPETDAAGIHLRVSPSGKPVWIRGQREKLLILFENLIFNAISFTPEEGGIAITAQVREGRAVIEVSDTGRGIAEEHLPHLFERFYVGRENQSEGSGLGLYIANMTVEEMGGEITVRSEVGRGTTFTIRLPLS